jgi:hypothetical protein
MKIWWRIGVLLLALSAGGCLVLDLSPAYDDESIGWEPRLLGSWQDPDDNAAMQIARGEWKSYRVHYVHPIETGDLTGYLTSLDDDRYLDLMPARGADRGSFLVPVHLVVRVALDEDRLELTPLSYDWFSDRLKAGHALPGLSIVRDQKENALIVSPTPGLRAWLRAQPPGGPMFGAGAVFLREKGPGTGDARIQTFPATGR